MKNYDALNELVPKTQELHRAIFDKGYEQGQKDALEQWKYDRGYDKGYDKGKADILDKIRAEIEKTASRYTISRERGAMGHVEWSDELIKESEILEIIDKCREAKTNQGFEPERKSVTQNKNYTYTRLEALSHKYENEGLILVFEFNMYGMILRGSLDSSLTNYDEYRYNRIYSYETIESLSDEMDFEALVDAFKEEIFEQYRLCKRKLESENKE